NTDQSGGKRTERPDARSSKSCNRRPLANRAFFRGIRKVGAGACAGYSTCNRRPLANRAFFRGIRKVGAGARAGYSANTSVASRPAAEAGVVAERDVAAVVEGVAGLHAAEVLVEAHAAGAARRHGAIGAGGA